MKSGPKDVLSMKTNVSTNLGLWIANALNFVYLAGDRRVCSLTNHYR